MKRSVVVTVLGDWEDRCPSSGLDPSDIVHQPGQVCFYCFCSVFVREPMSWDWCSVGSILFSTSREVPVKNSSFIDFTLVTELKGCFPVSFRNLVAAGGWICVTFISSAAWKPAARDHISSKKQNVFGLSQEEIKSRLTRQQQQQLRCVCLVGCWVFVGYVLCLFFLIQSIARTMWTLSVWLLVLRGLLWSGFKILAPQQTGRFSTTLSGKHLSCSNVTIPSCPSRHNWLSLMRIHTDSRPEPRPTVFGWTEEQLIRNTQVWSTRIFNTDEDCQNPSMCSWRFSTLGQRPGLCQSSLTDAQDCQSVYEWQSDWQNSQMFRTVDHYFSNSGTGPLGGDMRGFQWTMAPWT